MTIANGSFDVAGTAPGLADGWDSTFVGTAEEFADFAQNPGDGHVLALESHEAGWAGGDAQTTILELGGESEGTEAAVFNLGPSQRPIEDHEMGWGNPPLWMTSLSALDTALFDTNTKQHEDHEAIAFLPELPTPTAAVFSGNPEERHEAGWGATMILSFAAVGDPNLSTSFTETYEDLIPPIAFFADPSTSLLTLQASPPVAMADDERAQVENVGGSLPTPLEAEVSYYLMTTAGVDFQLTTRPASFGDPVDISDAGTGVHTLIRDPALWWSRLMTTV